MENIKMSESVEEEAKPKVQETIWECRDIHITATVKIDTPDGFTLNVKSPLIELDDFELDDKHTYTISTTTWSRGLPSYTVTLDVSSDKKLREGETFRLKRKHRKLFREAIKSKLKSDWITAQGRLIERILQDRFAGNLQRLKFHEICSLERFKLNIEDEDVVFKNDDVEPDIMVYSAKDDNFMVCYVGDHELSEFTYFDHEKGEKVIKPVAWRTGQKQLKPFVMISKAHYEKIRHESGPGPAYKDFMKLIEKHEHFDLLKPHKLSPLKKK